LNSLLVIYSITKQIVDYHYPLKIIINYAKKKKSQLSLLFLFQCIRTLFFFEHLNS